MSLCKVYKDYLKKLRELRTNPQATGELSLHLVLEELLRVTAARLGCSVRVVHEPRRTATGKPDFTITRSGLPIGYVEAEPFGTNLDALSGHAEEQNRRFINHLDNFLLTNFLEFRLFLGGKQIARVALPMPPEKGAVFVTEQEAEQLTLFLDRFFQGQLPATSTARELAIHLARRTRQLRNEVLSVLNTDGTSELHEAYEAFKEVLLPDLSQEEFADLYSQTVAYGLFAARCAVAKNGSFTRSAAGDLIPKTNPFLRKLFQRVAAHDLDDRIAWIANDIATLLARAEILSILRDFGRQAGKEDAVVHFYETFLAAYNPTLREIRGVYYTPEPVVDYIVRSVNYLLANRFSKPTGLADETVFVLDPACGTGGFLFAVVNLVRETVMRTYGAGVWNNYVEEKLLPRLFGFELLVAPYAIAHLKFDLQLQETGYQFRSNQRVGIYLTNTLEKAVQRSELLFGKFIADEANEAAAIKRDKPILVIIGNPPYSGHSANRSWRWVKHDGTSVKELTWIGRLLEDYKYVDGRPLGEKNPKWLQDDYVKFIRFAQWRIEQTGEGIIGFITNHAYLDNPTFRGMRWHLMQEFSELYVLNLHGNARKREKAPDGTKDENVFDIQQGVAIMLAVKQNMRTGNALPCRIFYADLWGERENKYKALATTDIATTRWTELNPVPPLYLFVPQDVELRVEYERGFKLNEIFPFHSVGVVTARDNLTIHWTPEEVWEAVTEFVNLLSENAREKFELGKDVHDWKVAWAQEDLRRTGVPGESAKSCLAPILYRPFDIRFTLYTGNSRGFYCRPRFEVMQHLLKGANTALVVGRRGDVIGDEVWNIVTAANMIVDFNVFRRGGGEVFPLYLFDHNGFDALIGPTWKKYPNLNQAFLAALAKHLGLRQEEPYGLPEGITPEDVFGYIYAVLHSLSYRERYGDFLRQELPRVPFTRNLDLFRDLAVLGNQLVGVHLLNEDMAPPLRTPVSRFPVPGNNKVEHVRYDEADRRIFINNTQFFDGVSGDVWEFRVGGYQVCEKWLEDRVGRVLPLDEILRYQRVVTAIAETLRLMEAIDERLPAFPLL